MGAKDLSNAYDLDSTTESEAEGSQGYISAINRSQAVIEFDLEGNILKANENFLNATGYTATELEGQHHSMFCDPAYVKSPAYKAFWQKLGSGEFDSGDYKRFTKTGEEIWIHASYNPIFDKDGKPVKVVKFATDITEEKVKNADYEGKINAVSKSQAVIEFDLHGNILTANENFLAATGYRLDELQGNHHRMFCGELANTPEYTQFWNKLGRGEFDAGEYKRYTKTGEEIWIQASYNPIFDAEGKPYKVVKFATDITEQKIKNADYEGKINAVSKAQAMIEFDLQGNILTANENFLGAVGYGLSEIQGKHHSMFCDPAYASTPEYQQFWAKLRGGTFDTGEYKRLGKNGKEIWIQASYNPIFDAEGKPYKVVKFATDITKLKHTIANVEATSQELDASAVQLMAASEKLSRDAVTTSQRTESSAAALEEVSSGVKSVASNMQEMSTAIKEIASSTNESAEMSTQTLNKARETNEKVSHLGTSSREVGDIIKVISSIAQQTNLLALNATIEAARAGAAGKGFEVVANEVKELANQTARATEDITVKIGAIQKDSDHAINAIAEIAESIESLNSIAGSIASAVEEQTASTNEISRIVEESSQGISEINETIQQVSNLSGENRIQAEESVQSSQNVGTLAAKLREYMNELDSQFTQ